MSSLRARRVSKYCRRSVHDVPKSSVTYYNPSRRSSSNVMNYVPLIIFANLITCLSYAFPLPTPYSRTTVHVSPRYAIPPPASASSGRNSIESALSQLGLTSEQTLNVLRRQLFYDESTLIWLASRFSKEDLIAIVVGHPPILTYDVRTKLEPTVRFYQDALSLDTDTDGMVDTRLALFLVGAPGLLEYNVKKRLAPRVKRVQASLDVDILDEGQLTAIATQTDSRFDNWLDRLTGVVPATTIDHSSSINNTPKRILPSYMVLSNLQSGGNIGNILRSASIFGCHECLVVGQRRHRLTGDHAARFDLPRRHVYSHADAKEYLKEKGVRVYGVEITEHAKPIMEYDKLTGVVQFPFDRKWSGAAFVMGNEGGGLSEKQREICDEYIYIPQTRGGSRDGGGSASLNVACAATVVLQAYCMWAGYLEAERDGEKFVADFGEAEELRYRRID